MPKLGYPHRPTIAFGIPLTGRPLPPEIMFAFHAMSPPMNMNTVMFKTKGMPIDAARNGFAEQAIKHEAKYLFFWDEDVELPAMAMRELVFWMEHHPECGVVGGIYCLKVPRPEPLVFQGIGTGPFWDWRVGEVFECAAIGMGCTLIRTAVFQDLEKPWFNSMDDMSKYLDNIPYGEQWTEDLWFCKQVAQSKKWKIYAHGQLLCRHFDLATGQSYELPPDSKPMRHLVSPKGKLKILDIGSGGNPIKTDEGTVVTVDVREEAKPDYRCDFRRLPFATGEFDVVFSSHTLEHVGRNEVNSVLDEWIRVLNPKGEFRIVVPNIAWAAEKILKGEVDFDTLNVLYGQQEYAENFHKMGFTPETLQELLKSKGFKHQDMEIKKYNIAIRAWREKPKKISNRKEK